MPVGDDARNMLEQASLRKSKAAVKILASAEDAVETALNMSNLADLAAAGKGGDDPVVTSATARRRRQDLAEEEELKAAAQAQARRKQSVRDMAEGLANGALPNAMAKVATDGASNLRYSTVKPKRSSGAYIPPEEGREGSCKSAAAAASPDKVSADDDEEEDDAEDNGPHWKWYPGLGWGHTYKIELQRKVGEGIGVGMGFEDGLVFITAVHPGTPAVAAGLLEMDRIVSVNGEDATETNVFSLLPKETTVFNLVIVRDDPEIEEPDGDEEDGFMTITLLRAAGESLGMALAVTSDGLLVGDVLEGSPADRCGLKELDLITKINGKELEADSKLSTLLPRDDTEFEFAVFRVEQDDKLGA